MALLSLTGSAFGTLCPQPEVISPCQCNKYFNLIDCSAVPQTTSLSGIFKRLSAELQKTGTRPVYDQFKLVESKLTAIDDDDLFSGISFRKLSIQRNSKLERISSTAFRSSFAVTTEIVIEDNESLGGSSKDSVELFRLLNQFSHLRSLHLTDSGVTQVPDGAFERPQNSLEELVLTDNRINRIGERAFLGLGGLKLLNLDGNVIDKLAPSSLRLPAPVKGPKSLLKLFMRSNRLTSSEDSFPPGIFSNLKERSVYLNLALNNLTSLPRPIFQGFFLHGHVLAIQKNPLVCDCDFEWLLDQGWLYNSSAPTTSFQLRDYQCTRPLVLSSGDDGEFDDFEDDQPITETTRDDYKHCHKGQQSFDNTANGPQKREQLKQKCILSNLSPDEEYSCLNSAQSQLSSILTSILIISFSLLLY